MGIDPNRVKAIFLEATDLADLAARAAYLDGACAGDAGLRARVEALLRAHDPEGSFLGTPAAVWSDPSQAAPQTFVVDPNPAGAPASDLVDTQALPASPSPGAKATGSKEEQFAFLAPSGRSGSLGRIGHYEVLQVLGRGGFGIVFRAFDEMLQRVVALKVLAPELAATSPARKRFLREARSSAQVRHENVVQVYQIAEQPLPYLAMEFIPGETLQQRLDRVGPLDVPETLRIGRQIAEGLAAAHATDLIHRDIKPGNVLLEGGQYKVKITDFGLARSADDASISQSGIIAGTPMYMAPEQAQGQKLDQRTDLFSLGSVLYQMVTGRPPFRATTAVAVLKRVAEDTPRPMREIISETPQWLCDVIAKLHEKNPDDRYQSAREVADVLADCESQLRASSKLLDYSRIPRSKPPLGPRHRLRFGRWAIAAMVLFLLGGLSVTEATGVTNFHGTVVRLFFPEGTLVVEVDDPGISVKIDESDIVITGAGAQEIRLKPGRYRVEARKDGQLVRQELVMVTNKGRQVVRVSKEPAPTVAPSGSNAVDAAAWERAVAVLPLAEQVKAVGTRLKELNLGFNGELEPTVENGVVRGLKFDPDHVHDLSPVRALTQLRTLTCIGSEAGRGRAGQLKDLSPLTGLPITHLNISNTPVADLSPLKGMKLSILWCSYTNVYDLSPLEGMPLEYLFCQGTRITDLSPLRRSKLIILQMESSTVADLVPLTEIRSLKELAIGRYVTDLTPVKGMPLKALTCAGAARLVDLTPIKGMPLTYLNLDSTQVADLSLVKEMPLNYLVLRDTAVTDLTPLRDMHTLQGLHCGNKVADLTPVKGLSLEKIILDNPDAKRYAMVLRAMATLKTINDKPVAEFWKSLEK